MTYCTDDPTYWGWYHLLPHCWYATLPTCTTEHDGGIE
jgi:hypothetical protein